MVKTPSRKYRPNRRVRQKGGRSAGKAEQLVWGIHPVLEALKICPRAVKEVFFDKGGAGRRLEQIKVLARENGIPVSEAGEKMKSDLVSSPGQADPDGIQGVWARITLPTLTLPELLARLKGVPAPPFLLALDSIQDPHNLGAIIRSAAAAGANGIILPRDRSASLTGTVIKVSAGSVFHIDICMVTNLVSSFAVLKKNGIWIFGATTDASRSLYDTDLTVPACLVIGSEGKGLRPLVAGHCDQNIAIPMHGSLDSLNASVAAGIILFETVRQRKMQ